MDFNCNGANLGNRFFLLYLSGYRLPGYRATWLPIIPYCVEWATDGLPIVCSPLEASDKSSGFYLLGEAGGKLPQQTSQLPPPPKKKVLVKNKN